MNVLSVLVYWSRTWKVTITVIQKLTSSLTLVPAMSSLYSRLRKSQIITLVSLETSYDRRVDSRAETAVDRSHSQASQAIAFQKKDQSIFRRAIRTKFEQVCLVRLR